MWSAVELAPCLTPGAGATECPAPEDTGSAEMCKKWEEWAWMGNLGRQVHVHWDTTDHSMTHVYH